MRLLAICLLLLAGCGGSVATDADEPLEPPAFDIAAVRASFTDECRDPIVVDELFCEQVDIAGMSAEGTTLIVPTTLAALDGMRDRATAICDQLATVHFDGEGVDLSYTIIGIRDRDGGDAAACTL